VLQLRVHSGACRANEIQNSGCDTCVFKQLVLIAPIVLPQYFYAENYLGRSGPAQDPLVTAQIEDLQLELYRKESHDPRKTLLILH